jgi:hypothetical protein
MKPTIIILVLVFICIGLQAQTDRELFEKACLIDTFWVDINKTPYEYEKDAIYDMTRLQKAGHIKTAEVLENVQGYWISCKCVRNPEFSNYRYWLRKGKLSRKIYKKALIFVD